MLLIVGLVAGAVAGGLVEYLLGFLVPEKPKVRHLVAILAFILIFSAISIWSSPNDSQTDEVMLALKDIQTREVELATAFANSVVEASITSDNNATAEAFATKAAELENTRQFLVALATEKVATETHTPSATLKPHFTPTIIQTPISSPMPTPIKIVETSTPQSITFNPKSVCFLENEVFPSPGATINGGEIVFSWPNKYTVPNGYQFQIQINEGGGDRLYITSVRTSTNQATITSLPTGGGYNWSLSLIDPSGTSTECGCEQQDTFDCVLTDDHFGVPFWYVP